MPEMPDVVTLTTISSDWGNDIRDRTIQRYSSVANRTTEHPTPSEGDLSYLEDTNEVFVYNGSAWVLLVPGPVATANIADDAITGDKLANNIMASVEVDGSVEVASSAIGPTPATEATVNLTIPAGWGSWKCAAFVSGSYTVGSGEDLIARITIDGTAQQALQVASGVGAIPFSVGGYRSGMTTTGSRAVVLTASTTAGVGNLSDIYLYARAVRLT